jgi:hypothetical protein
MDPFMDSSERDHLQGFSSDLRYDAALGTAIPDRAWVPYLHTSGAAMLKDIEAM